MYSFGFVLVRCTRNVGDNLTAFNHAGYLFPYQIDLLCVLIIKKSFSLESQFFSRVSYGYIIYI